MSKAAVDVRSRVRWGRLGDPTSEAHARGDRRTLVEVGLVWLLYAVVAIEILVTYARLPWYELYHVTGSGLEGGASRAFVFLNFPVALAAIAILLVLLDRLSTSVERAIAVLAIVLCAAVIWPGVVNQADLDARPVNAIAAAGVGIALALTIWSGRQRVVGRLARKRGDAARLAIAACLLTIALPWIAADLGLSFSGLPVLGSLYQTGELRSQPDVPGFHPAVHHGHHHGMDGTLLCFTALLLSRVLTSVRARRLRSVLGACLALMFCYGLCNIANDFWLEQVVKRGWTSWQLPDVTTVKVSVAWALIITGAACLWALLVRPTLQPRPATEP